MVIRTEAAAIMDALKKEEFYTIDDIYALPDGKRAELVDGRIYYMAPPTRTHQQLLFSLSRKIADYVEPDISVICDLSKLDDKGCHGAPDWVIEIVSPGNKPMDYFTKLFKYRTAGVREYWIVDSERKMITVYGFEKETMEQYSFEEEIPVGIYEGFFLRVY